MASSDDDEDLKRAIAMSLGEDTSRSPTVINLVDSEDDDDDEDLRKAIAMSLQDSERTEESSFNSEQNTEVDVIPTPRASQSNLANEWYASNTPPESQQSTQREPVPQKITFSLKTALPGLFGLDRKAMEQERLARLGKRKRDASPERPVKLPMKAPPSIPQVVKGNARSTANQSGIQYPHGVIKRTWAYKHPRTNDIKLEEVIQTPPPNIAILSAMDWDDKWVFSKLRPETTKQIWIMNAKGQDLQDKMMAEATESRIPNFKPHFPPMDGNIRQMHSKLMLLFHQTYLRIVVPTANMLNVHWGETNKDARGQSWQAAVMENSLFLVDLPRRLDDKPSHRDELTPFGARVLEFLEAQQIGKNVTEGLLKFDFSATSNIRFVHAIPGALTDKYQDRTGLEGLRRAVDELDLGGVRTMQLDYAASSLGAVKATFLKQLYQVACGRNSTAPTDFLDRIRIYFPTHDTVKNSTGGIDCGGVITLNRSYYKNESFPKQCMRNYKSTRPGVLSHNKMLLARGRKADGTAVAWAYVGSANLSVSAWGNQKELKSGKLGKPNIRNWECGVMVPVPFDVLEKLVLGEGEVPPMSVFAGVVEVPFVFPGEAYGDRQPWFFGDYLE